MGLPTRSDEMQRELRATLSARREMGPDYEDHLIEAFVEKFTQQFRAQLPVQSPAPAPAPSSAPSAGQRLALAIVSICVLLPLMLIIFAFARVPDAFPAFLLILMCVTVLGINVIFNIRR